MDVVTLSRFQFASTSIFHFFLRSPLVAGSNRSVLLVTHRADDLDARWRTVHVGQAD